MHKLRSFYVLDEIKPHNRLGNKDIVKLFTEPFCTGVIHREMIDRY